MISLLLDRFSLGKQSRVLDLGCGTGQIALRLASYDSEVVAVDPQEDMLKEGKIIASLKNRNSKAKLEIQEPSTPLLNFLQRAARLCEWQNGATLA